MIDLQKRTHRIDYAQNFIKNSSLARYAVSLADITDGDIVIEIGPGRGVITEALLQKTSNLILIEKDKVLYRELIQTYKDIRTVKILNADILRFSPINKEYKIFSNPPFNIISQLIKHYAFETYSPREMYLFMQKEAQKRYEGKPMENQLSIILKTFYNIRELYRFKRTDFSPTPSVDVNLVGFYKISNILINDQDKPEYILFVQYGFQQQKANLAKNFEKIFTHEQWKRLTKDLGLPPKSKASGLTPTQWGNLFAFYKIGVMPEKQKIVKTFRPRV